MALYLRTFGTPALEADGAAVRLNHKELALLIYLRTTGRPHSRGAIGDLLWAKTFQQRNDSVNTAVTNLRAKLPPGAIPARAPAIDLAVELPSDLDDVRPVLVDEPSAETVLTALRAYSAPFMDGYEHLLKDGVDPYIEWMETERKMFSERLQHGLDEACAAAAAASEWTTVQTLARAGANTFPEWPAAGEWLRKSRLYSRLGTRRSRWLLGAATLLLAMGLIQSHAGREPPLCPAGASHAQLVRQIYPAEANLALRPGEPYTPTFILKNVGACTWPPGVHVERVRAVGPGAGPLSGALSRHGLGRPVRPDSVGEIRVPVIGPAAAGRYEEDWILLDREGKRVAIDGGTALSLRFQVLPERVPPCRPGEVVADLIAQSPPRKDRRIRPGERFTTSWTIANRGSCEWDSTVSLRFRSVNGPRLSSDSVIHVEEPVIPSNAYTFQLRVQAPLAEVSALETWEMVGPDGRSVAVSDDSAVAVRLVVSRTGEIRSTAPVCGPGKSVAGFLNSERIADGSSVAPGELIPKEWTLLNRGDCTWPAGMHLRFARSDPVLPSARWPEVVTTREVPPQDTYTFPAPFTAPKKRRHYRLRWKLYDPAGDSVRISSGYTIWADFDVRGTPGAADAPASLPRGRGSP